MILPSKELLSEVLGEDYNDRLVDWFQIEEDNYLRTYYDCGRFDEQGRPTGLGIEINIYELAHKCKEWAYSLGFDIYSDLNGADVCNVGSNYSIAPFHHNITEPEAIFKACEWILKETK